MMIDQLRTLSDTLPLEDFYDFVLENTGYRAMFERKNDPESITRLENIQELRSSIVSYAAGAQTPTLSGFLEEVALFTDVDRYDADADAMVLMTLHAAKGLEFPVVYMVGMEEGILPHARVYEAGPSELEEERRLCYVGMTRAREELHLVYAYSRLTFGQRSYQPVSRFIADMGDQLLQATTANETTYEMDAGDDFYSDEMFEVGDRVKSQAFGEGTIIDVDGLAVSIEFDKGQTKKLNAEYARLEKL